MQRRLRSPGFTLIELLVVMAILGLSLAIVPPLFTNVIESAQIKKATRELAGGLRDSRSQAIIQQQEKTFTIDVEDASYRMSDRRRQLKLPDNTSMTLTTARSEQQTETIASIRFFPDGSSSGGRIELQKAPQYYLAIDINWLTGQITISP